MSAEPPSKGLHLSSLSVKGLRGIADLSIPRLGRVTLIAGKNGVGKTTLLDAVRIYASRGSYSVLTSILRNREEFVTVVDEDGDEISAPDYEALFHGRRASTDSCISIGPESTAQQLTIKLDTSLLQQDLPLHEDFVNDDEPLLEIEFEGIKQKILCATPRAHLVYIVTGEMSNQNAHLIFDA